MNHRNQVSVGALALVAMLLSGGMQPAHAITTKAILQSIYQNGMTAAVNVGHTNYATSNMNRLTAGGSFVASCPSTYTGTISRQRTRTAESYIGGTELYVTIPEWLPATLNMPGFENVPPGTTLNCSYEWTVNAEESTFTIGFGGIGMTIGGGKVSDSGAVSFVMRKAGEDGERDDTGCIH
ncbi:MAG TPA: hypothetical protein VFP37_11215 [Steroidobacteraceae bacterium]|nr:hypothetical protein [Steroidobacteraceae bacterium]